MNENKQAKKVINNIILVAIGNICSLFAGVLVGFVIPKIMGVNDYGYYKKFTLYSSYIGLFHFGFCDGIYLIYAGKKFEELEKEKFRLYSKFLLIFQLITSLVILVISIPFFKNEYGFIFMFVALSLISKNLTAYYQIISQITSRFKEYAFRNVINSILTIITVCILFLFYKIGKYETLNYKIYICITVVVSFIMTLWYMLTYKDITFGNSSGIKNESKNIKKIFKIGFLLMISNLVTGLILTLDRQFVSILYNNNIYSIYAFAYNMLSLITTIVAAIATVLYPTINNLKFDDLQKNYKKLLAIISILMGCSLIAYYPLDFIVNYFLSDYVESLIIFKIILPGLIPSCCISIVMFNYYKTLNISNKYFFISIIVLVLSFLTNVIAQLIFKSPIAISIASVFVMCVWYFITNTYLLKKLELHSLKNDFYVLLMMLIFYLSVFLINNIYISFVLYLSSLLILSLLLFIKEIKEFLKK